MAVERGLWFERKFASVELERLPCLIERLRGTPARLEERLSRVPHEQLVRRDGSRWSVQENVGHLWDLEALWIGRVEDFVGGAEALRPADLENKKTHEADHNGADLGVLLRNFRDNRAALVDAIESMPEGIVARTALHPRLQQPMTVADLAFFVAEHDDHHLAAITELLAR